MNASRRPGIPIQVLRSLAPGRPLVAPTTGVRLQVVQPSGTDSLVERARAGDPTAFRELFVQHRADVARLVHRMTGRTAELEDLVQEVFLQVHRSLGDFRGQSKFSTWLHRVTVNVVLMSRRAARSRPVLRGDDLDERSLGPRMPTSTNLPDEEAATRERLEAFRRVLERLPEKKRTVFVLHELEGMAPAEIAEIVEAPVLTVRTRLFYARKELCELLRDEPSLAKLADLLAAPRTAAASERSAREAPPTEGPPERGGGAR